MTDALTASGGVAFSRHGWAMQREAEAMQMVWLQEHSSLDAFAAEIQSQLDASRMPSSSHQLRWRPLAESARPGAWVQRSGQLEGMELLFCFCPMPEGDAKGSQWNLTLKIKGFDLWKVSAAFAMRYELGGRCVEVPCQQEVARRLS